MKATRPDLGTQEWKAKRKAVLNRDQHTCYICQGEANQVDHIIAKVNGGTNDMDNLAAVCARCNATKGSRIDRPKRNINAKTSSFSQANPPTRSSARISPPETNLTEGNPFQ